MAELAVVAGGRARARGPAHAADAVGRAVVHGPGIYAALERHLLGHDPRMANAGQRRHGTEQRKYQQKKKKKKEEEEERRREEEE